MLGPSPALAALHPLSASQWVAPCAAARAAGVALDTLYVADPSNSYYLQASRRARTPTETLAPSLNSSGPSPTHPTTHIQLPTAPSHPFLPTLP
eukprot:2371932-Prymnesium_polylepis.1